MTISSWLNFGRPAPPGRGLRRGENLFLRLTTASAQCLCLSEPFFIMYVSLTVVLSLCNNNDDGGGGDDDDDDDDGDFTSTPFDFRSMRLHCHSSDSTSNNSRIAVESYL